MRCPDCRKKVHTDDVYCVWCGAGLKKSLRSADSSLLSEEISLEDEVYQIPDVPERKQSRPVRWILPALLVLGLLPALVIFWNRPVDFFSETTVITVPENAETLDLVLAQWEGFTLRGVYVTYDETEGILEIVFSAENRSKRTIICGNPLITCEGCQLQSTMYLELGPKESAVGSIRLETDPLQSLGCLRIRELALSFLLYDRETGTILTRTEPVCLPMDANLPEREIQMLDTILQEETGLQVRLTGISTDPVSGELRLYTLAENTSGQENFLYLKDIRVEGADTGASFYYMLPPDVRLLTSSRIPGAASGEVRMEIVTGTGTEQSCVIPIVTETE